MDILQNTDYSGLFALYMIISVNFLSPTFPCNLQKLLNESILLRHVAAFLTLYFFVVITLKTKPKPGIWNIKLIQALLLYSFFIISSRCDYRFLLIFIGCLAVDYFIQTHYSEQDSHHKHHITKNEKIMYKVADIFGMISIVSLLIGFGISIYYKPSNQSFLTFLFGHHDC